eukprot:767906-Hanusia_phi.AAC.4
MSAKGRTLGAMAAATLMATSLSVCHAAYHVVNHDVTRYHHHDGRHTDSHDEMVVAFKGRRNPGSPLTAFMSLSVSQHASLHAKRSCCQRWTVRCRKTSPPVMPVAMSIIGGSSEGGSETWALTEIKKIIKERGGAMTMSMLEEEWMKVYPSQDLSKHAKHRNKTLTEWISANADIGIDNQQGEVPDDEEYEFPELISIYLKRFNLPNNMSEYKNLHSLVSVILLSILYSPCPFQVVTRSMTLFNLLSPATWSQTLLDVFPPYPTSNACNIRLLFVSHSIQRELRVSQGSRRSMQSRLFLVNRAAERNEDPFEGHPRHFIFCNRLCNDFISDSDEDMRDWEWSNLLSEDGYNQRTIAILINSLAKLKLKDELVLSKVSRIILGKCTSPGLRTLNIALFLNGYARLNFFPPGLFAGMSQAILANGDDVFPHDQTFTTDLVFSEFILDFKHPNPMLLRFQGASGAKDVSNILNAYARNGECDQRLLKFFSSVLRRLEAQGVEFSAQAIGNIANAYTRLGYSDENLSPTVGKVILAIPPEDLDTQAISTLSNFFANQNTLQPEVLRCLEFAVLQSQLDKWTGQSIGITLNALQRISSPNIIVLSHLLDACLQLDDSQYDSQGGSETVEGLTGGEQVEVVSGGENEGYEGGDKEGKEEEEVLRNIHNHADIRPFATWCTRLPRSTLPGSWIAPSSSTSWGRSSPGWHPESSPSSPSPSSAGVSPNSRPSPAAQKWFSIASYR